MMSLPPLEWNQFWLAQLVGFVALILGVAAFSVKQNEKLKLLQILQSSTYGVHFYLLGAMTGSAMALLAAGRNVVSLLNPPRITGVLFMVLYLVIGYYRYANWYDILPILAVVIGTYAIFYSEGLALRYLFLAVTSLWLVHNLVVGSIGPIIMETFILCANLRFVVHARRSEALQNEI